MATSLEMISSCWRERNKLRPRRAAATCRPPMKSSSTESRAGEAKVFRNFRRKPRPRWFLSPQRQSREGEDPCLENVTCPSCSMCVHSVFQFLVLLHQVNVILALAKMIPLRLDGFTLIWHTSQAGQLIRWTGDPGWANIPDTKKPHFLPVSETIMKGEHHVFTDG